MTYIVKHLPSIEELKLELEKTPSNIQIYAKYEGFDGSSESIDYLDTKLDEYYKSKFND
jgi:cell fate (sporulation/competence/biofilm development) regulator YmcA (YheA/YmcA/DUF963 family)